jgi:uncharacterized membrane protein
VDVVRYLLAVLLLAMAVGQLSDFGSFVDIVATYEICGDTTAWMLAASLIVAELAAGLGLLVPRLATARRLGAAAVAVLVAMVWSALAVQAFARGLAVPNCGCFGVDLGQVLRCWVLLEDAEFGALALWVRHRTRRDQATTTTPSLPAR